MSSRQMEITSEEYLHAWIRYIEILITLPEDLRAVCPRFEKFLSPANYTNFSTNPVKLSITGTERYKMMLSPHVNTLLAMYAAQRFDKNNEEGYEV